MKNIWLPVFAGATLVLVGCTSNMSSGNQTEMGKKICKNGVCTQQPKVISTKDAAPVPTVLPPLLHTTEKALFAQ
jgi:hypothetical protein